MNQLKNKEKLIEYRKEYYQKNKEKMAIRNKKYTHENKEILAAKAKIYIKENKEKINIYNQKRRSKKKKLTSTLTLNQWEQTKQYFDNKCCYCGKEKPLAQEHFIALKEDGEYTNNNIIPSCKSCNSHKSSKNFFEWYSKYKYYSKKRESKILKYLGYVNECEQQLKIV